MCSYTHMLMYTGHMHVCSCSKAPHHLSPCPPPSPPLPCPPSPRDLCVGGGVSGMWPLLFFFIMKNNCGERRGDNLTIAMLSIVYRQCLFYDPYLTTHQSNIGVRLREKFFNNTHITYSMPTTRTKDWLKAMGEFPS